MIVRPSVLRLWWSNRQWDVRASEAGGVLLGVRRPAGVEVSGATEPFATDRRTRSSFVRGSGGHQEAATHLWATSCETVDYLGEWHTHPESDPQPSAIDLAEWDAIWRARGRIAALVFAIVGLQGAVLVCVRSGIGLQRCVEVV